jgi:Arc/MetJ-type ribon-helix-helix transcriptional regulator
MKKPDDPLVRKSVSLRKSVWDEIEAYKVAGRFASEAEAIRRLLSDRLKSEEKK